MLFILCSASPYRFKSFILVIFFYFISNTVSETVESVWHIYERLFKSYDETLSPSIYLSYKNSKSIISELMQTVRSSLLWIYSFVLKVNYIQDHRTQKTMLPIEIPFKLPYHGCCKRGESSGDWNQPSDWLNRQGVKNKYKYKKIDHGHK